MIEKRTFTLIALFLVLATAPALACGTLLPEPESEFPPPPTLVINTPAVETPDGVAIAPTMTSIGGEPPIDGTSIADSGALVRALVDVNVRAGPGVQYDRDGYLLAGESATVIGQDAASGWWKIQCPLRSEGNECWVTGGSRYTSVADPESVPPAPIPPTPTAASTATAATEAEVDAGITQTPAATSATTAGSVPAPGSYLVYVDAGTLFAARLEPSDAGATVTGSRPLTSRENVVAAYISPLGNRVAYLVARDSGNALYVVSPSGDDNTLLVESADLPALPDPGGTMLPREINQVQWLADSETLAFNTRTAPVELVTGPAYDFWTVQDGAKPIERIPAGGAGGWFTISPSNEMLMSYVTEIVRVDLDGSNRRQVAAFAQVNTAGEYIYFPAPQWLAGGPAARVAIPGPEPFAPGASADLLALPAGGAQAVVLGTVPGNILFDPVYWTDDGARLAYVRRIDSASAPELVLATGSGSEAIRYDQGEMLRFLAWNPGSENFVYSGNGFYAVGSPGKEPVSTIIPEEESALAAEWIAQDRFVLAVGESNSWRLVAGNAVGAFVPLVELRSSLPIFDIWIR